MRGCVDVWTVLGMYVMRLSLSGCLKYERRAGRAGGVREGAGGTRRQGYEGRGVWVSRFLC